MVHLPFREKNHERTAPGILELSTEPREFVPDQRTIRGVIFQAEGDAFKRKLAAFFAKEGCAGCPRTLPGVILLVSTQTVGAARKHGQGRVSAFDRNGPPLPMERHK
jgi:hypothetical protein